MPERMRAYFQLVRLPNLFTAAADIFAGFFYCGGQLEDWPILLRLSLASMCLYAGGAALNDVCDVARDAIERPERPIPSGKVPLGTGLRLAVTLLLVGIALAATVSLQSAGMALALAITITLYDFLWKKSWVAPGLMGACRGLNIALGMFLAMPWTNNLNPWSPVALLWLYITGVTAFARTESRESSRLRLSLATAAMCMAVAGLWLIPSVAAHGNGDTLRWCIAALLIWIAYNGASAATRPAPAAVQRAVKRFILALVLVDAFVAWAGAGYIAAVLTAMLLIPTIGFARSMRVT